MVIDIKRVKIVVTSPVAIAMDIIKALGDLGVGVIGNYSYCGIIEECKGTFKGNENSNPFIGEKNKLETVSEVKVEMECSIDIVKEAIKKIREVHPYEEPAISIFPLIDERDI